MTYNTLDWQIDRRVLTLTLNRPAQLNAFTVEMANELIDAYQRASEDDAGGRHRRHRGRQGVLRRHGPVH